MKFQWSYVVYLLFFIGMAGVTTQFTNIFGEKSNTIFYWMAALGVTGTAFFAFLQQKWNERGQKKAEELAAAAAGGGGGAAAAAAPTSGGEGDVDLLVKDAETKLLASKIGQGAKKISELPVIFVLGDKASTKTTVMMNSRMEPELLSGQVYHQDNQIVPTRSANFWFAKKAVFVETGGIWTDPGAWAKLLKKLSPPKMKSVFGGGGSAPRAAILCVDVERFLQPNASDTMTTVARGVQTRLNEISQQFGISFPVYVLFTKSDRLTFFHDFVRNLSTEESTQVFGTTLPLRNSKGGVYAEEETQRLNQMFNELFYSLCDKRIEFLPRENDAEKLPGCYEFPREFRKIRAALIQFLVDVGRPSQLSTSPFLRGFYFTGVRPVVVSDVAATPIAQPRRSAVDPGGGATTMFKIGDLQAQMAQMPQVAQQQGGRKVPQWVFLSHLFNDVILEDKAALGASEASTKTSGLQRVLLSLLAFFAFIWIVGGTISFFRNRGLESDAIEATKQIKSVRLAAGAIPSPDDLKRLESLRKQLEQLSEWHRDGAPYSYRWGLYVGDDLLPAVRRAWYDCFNQLLLSDTQRRMLNFMRPLPPKAREEDDYNYAYNTLRAHLMTTSEWQRSAGPGEDKFLGDTLMARWIEKRETDVGEERRGLSDLQFRFYGGDLKNGNLLSTKDDTEAVDKTRTFLASFSGFDRFYNAMLAEADKKNPSVNFNKKYPGSGQVVVNNRDVRGAFTKEGWAFMQAAFKNRGKNYGGEEWVLMSNRYKSAAAIPENLDQLLKDRYTSDYIKTWRDYYGITNVLVPYGDTRDAARKLMIHSGASVPVLALIGLGSYHTNVEPAADPYAEKVIKAFKWAHIVVPPSKDLAIVSGNNQPYKGGLSNLQISVEAAAAKDPPDQGDAQTTQMRAQDALGQARQVMAFPGPDLDGKLDQTIARIMEAPIKGVDGLFSPAKRLNAAGAALCTQFNIIQRKFPFDPAVDPEVTLAELNDLLRPQSGRFWQFYEQSLKPFLQKQGNDFVPSGGGVTLNPAFLRFFTQVARFSDAMYRGGQDPQLTFNMQFVEAFLRIDKTQAKSGSITIDGKTANLGAPALAFTWTGMNSHAVAVNVNTLPVFSKTGMWTIFRFFADAGVTPQGTGYLITNPLIFNKDVFADTKFLVNLNGAPAVFDKNFMRGLRCISTVATK